MHNRALRARAFTLIELLVVVAIIALLVSILLPSLSRARQKARGVVCLGQCRELGHGLVLYHTEYASYPAHQWRLADGSRLRWFNALAMYVQGAPQTGSYDPDLPQQTTVLQCPATLDWEVGRNNSYGYNYKYVGSTRDNAEPDNRYRPYETFPVKELQSPGETIAFGDSDGTGWTEPWGPERSDHHPDADQDPHRLGNHGYTLDPTYIPLRSQNTYSGGELEPYAWHNWRTYLSDRHGGEGNTVFADGHGQPLLPAVVYRDNRLWNGLGFDPGSDPDALDADLDPHVTERWDSSSGQEWRYPEALVD